MHGPSPDPFDPNFLWLEQHTYRIYGDDRECHFALVDEIDYHWAVEWRWIAKINQNRGAPKIYIFRPAYNGGPNLRKSLYLHIEIQKRTGSIPPSDKHIIVDHRNGNSLDCRRQNLRWATPSMNSRNIHGSFSHDLYEG